jgi:hypothetical protein
MELDTIEVLRRIRHILTGWLLLFVTNASYLVPGVGVPLTFVLAAVTFFYILRIFAYGHPFQGVILTLALGSTCISHLVFPEMVASSRSTAWAGFRDAFHVAESAKGPELEPEDDKPRPTPDPEPASDRKRPSFLPPPELLNSSIIDRNTDFPELPRARNPTWTPTSTNRQGRTATNGGTTNTTASIGADRARPKTPEQEVLELIMKCRKAEQRRDIAGAMAPYQGKVLYFGKTEMWKDIRADKLDYFQKWPQISESIVGEPKVESLPKGYARVSFRSTFRVSNPNTRKWCSGTIDNEYLLLAGRAGWLIASQEGDVSNLQKGTF